MYIVLLNSILFYAQRSLRVLEDFKDQNKWGTYVAPVIYKSAVTEPRIGNRDFENKSILSLNFGADYIANPELTWTFRTGFHLNWLPYYNFEYRLSEEDLPNSFSNYTDAVKEKKLGQLIISVPLFIEHKTQVSSQIYFSAYSGIDLAYLKDGQVRFSATYSSEELNESREVFGFYTDTSSDKFFFYPNFVIAPGFYFMGKKLILQTSLVYQRPIIGYFKGEYQFSFLETENSRGEYELSGEYLGLGINLFLKKSKNQ